MGGECSAPAAFKSVPFYWTPVPDKRDSVVEGGQVAVLSVMECQTVQADQVGSR